jgi:SAM-dependent methyltransferase
MGINKTLKNLLRICPICGNIEGEKLHTQKFFLPENHILPKEYDVVCCTYCNFIFADTSAKQEEYNKYYQLMSKYEDKSTASGGGDKLYDAERLKQTAIDIDSIIKNKNTSILDIGCGNGGLLSELRKLGYNNITGLDPSPTCVQNMIDQGINGICGGLFDDNFKNQKFDNKYDLVILTHVFEHIYDLKNAVRNISSYLNDNGIVYIETPDASRYNDFFVSPYYYFDTEHINHFDEVFLSKLFTLEHFDLISFSKKDMPVSDNSLYPAVYAFFKKNNSRSYQEKIVKYIKTSGEKSYYPEIEELSKSKEKIVVFGAGNYTFRMLENTSLKYCNIVNFIDNDSNKHGKLINGIKVSSPDILKNIPYTIVICSALFSDEIIKQIKDLKINNKCIVL